MKTTTYTTRLIAFIALLTMATNNLLFAQNTKLVEGNIFYTSKNALSNLASSKNFSTFYNAIQTAEANSQFIGNSVITVLAPANKAFDNLPIGYLDSLLLPQNRSNLLNMINYHIIAGKITSAEIARQIKLNKGTATFTTISGNKLIAKIDSNRNIVLTDASGQQSIISRFDVALKNGVLHTVTKVLLPPLQQPSASD